MSGMNANERINALKSQVIKQQKEINRLIMVSERCQAAVLEIAAFVENSAGKNNGL